MRTHLLSFCTLSSFESLLIYITMKLNYTRLHNYKELILTFKSCKTHWHQNYPVILPDCIERSVWSAGNVRIAQHEIGTALVQGVRIISWGYISHLYPSSVHLSFGTDLVLYSFNVPVQSPQSDTTLTAGKFALPP